MDFRFPAAGWTNDWFASSEVVFSWTTSHSILLHFLVPPTRLPFESIYYTIGRSLVIIFNRISIRNVDKVSSLDFNSNKLHFDWTLSPSLSPSESGENNGLLCHTGWSINSQCLQWTRWPPNYTSLLHSPFHQFVARAVRLIGITHFSHVVLFCAQQQQVSFDTCPPQQQQQQQQVQVFNEALLLENEATKQKIAVNYSYYRAPLTV